MSGLTPDQFKQLPKDGTQFEALVCQLLEAMGYRILEKPAIGTEGGRDVLVERILKDEMVERRERVVVQCKHHAHSGKAVGDSDVGVWVNAMNRYKARGYLLVTVAIRTNSAADLIPGSSPALQIMSVSASIFSSIESSSIITPVSEKSIGSTIVSSASTRRINSASAGSFISRP